MSSLNSSLLISSKEIIEKTGISRATLNNYIKVGILPRPLVKKPEDVKTRAKKIGYFPQTVIERIEIVKEMKRKGYSMEDIVNRLHDFSTIDPAMEERRELKEKDLLETTSQESGKGGPERINSTEEGLLKLTINDLQCPAYLLNQKFEIEWINEEAEKQIFHRQIRSIREAESRNVFKLLLDIDARTGDQSKNELIGFHMTFMKSRYLKASLAQLYIGISERELHTLEKIYDHAVSVPESINEAYLNLVGFDGTVTSFHLYWVIFREGLLFIYVPVDSLLQGVVELLSNRTKVINELLKQRIPSLVSFCVLVADLQDSVRICADLPPEEYFELINQTWKCMEGSFKKYYGIYGKHTGDGMVYYFLKDTDSNYLMNSIYCALELREKVKKLGMEWKMRKGWFHDLYMNIGINEGQEYFGTIVPSPGIEFTALGDSVNYTGRLSDFARYGSIWTTKNLINKLSIEERNKIRFGIRRKDHDREIVVENMFSRVMDLFQDDNSRYSKFMDIATLPVTEILDRCK
ncbi:MAG: adenylate/guanylate cyclase domain-containing protein [Syntrophales bacterium]|nr:adenylate/guanylate cyclase domain-containing protein [Syntrophales bacterium]